MHVANLYPLNIVFALPEKVLETTIQTVVVIAELKTH